MKAILIICVFSILASGCKKILGSDGTYSIKGKMLRDCSGAPFAIYNLRLHHQGGPITYDSRDWTTTTDLDGNFVFSNIPIKYNGAFRMLDDEGKTWWLEGGILIINKDIIDIGTFYGEQKIFTVAKFT